MSAKSDAVKTDIERLGTAETNAITESNAAIGARLANLDKTSEVTAAVIMKPNKIVETRLAAPVELALACEFKNFLFFYLRFAKLLTMALWPKKVSDNYSEPDIILKIK